MDCGPWIRRIPEELQNTAAPATTLSLEKPAASKINKTLHRSTSGDEGNETAAQHLKAFAKMRSVDLDHTYSFAGYSEKHPSQRCCHWPRSTSSSASGPSRSSSFIQLRSVGEPSQFVPTPIRLNNQHGMHAGASGR